MPERLSAFDNTFLSLERGELPMHIGALMVFEGPAPTFEEFSDAIEQRLDVIPRYRQRVREVPLKLNTPVWVDDTHFQLDYHLHHIALPQPGGEVQLQELTGRLLSQRLDLSRPLWEMWLIVGLDGDRWAILNKTHHAMVDGGAGRDMMTILMDTEPDAPAPHPREQPPAEEPTKGALVAAALGDRVREPAKTVEQVGNALKTPKDFAVQTGAQVAGTFKTGGRLLHTEDFLVGPVGPHRRWAWVEMDLDVVKRIKNSWGGTVNDVLLAAVAGGFRALLLERGDELDTDSIIRTMVPVSVRAPGDTSGGNAVSAIFTDLPVGESDPVTILKRITKATAKLKRSPEALSIPALLGAAPFVSPNILAGAGRLAAKLPQRSVGTVTTNVPGPQHPLYFMGRKLTGLIPFVPLGPQIRVAIAMMSYNGGVWAGITADYDAVPDLEQVAEGMDATLAELDLAASSA